MSKELSLGLLLSGGLGYIIASKLIVAEKDITFIATDKNSSAIQELAQANNIPLYIGNPRNSAIESFLHDKQIDVLLSINYLFLINENLISLPKTYAINLHGSLLPKYRGRTPHVWSIINNEQFTGVTAHLIVAECDAGDIVEQVQIPIGESETGNDILLKYNSVYPELVETILTKIRINRLQIRPQDHSMATFYGKRSPKDGEIDWSWQKERIRNWVRAQAYPYPGAFSFIKGERITIDKISFADQGYEYDRPDGLVLSTIPQLTIKTPNGAVTIDSYREKELEINIGDILRR